MSGARAGIYSVMGSTVLYGLAIGGLYFLQDSLIFPRAAAFRATRRLPPDAERLDLITKDGHRIVGNLLRRPATSGPVLLGFGGNAWNADDFTHFLAQRFAGLDVAAFHYRGYGPSEGVPGEAALCADALQIYDDLVERL